MATATSRTPELSTEEWKKAVCALFTNVKLYDRGTLHPAVAQSEKIQEILTDLTTLPKECRGDFRCNPHSTVLYEMNPEGVIVSVFFGEKKKHAEEKFLESRSVEEHRRSVEEHLRSVEEHLSSVKKYQHLVEERRRSVEERRRSVEERQRSVEEHQRSVEKYQHSVEEHHRLVEKYLRPVHSIGLNYSPCTVPGHNCAGKIVEKYEDTKPEIHFSREYINTSQKDEKEGIKLLIENGFELKVLDTDPIFQYLLDQAPNDKLKDELKDELDQAYKSTADVRSQRDEATRVFLAKPCFNKGKVSKPTATTSTSVDDLADSTKNLTLGDGKSEAANEATSKKKGSAK